ncbi:MAG: DUF2283 domain-containing protein [Melioribacteraceae bacterium]|nr:DUF2283 domain-containing protein [Saprospiraceae bacterium]MCF8355761.1 DUF2283 domain-containing protein [Melioribacteraceae bacterium]MCF8394789.1 DUF2283 domain-containing protein [Melioribacteraceae bacterium]
MDKVKIYYSKDKDTIDIWFGNPELEMISEEIGEGLVLKKDKDGKVIGIEKIYTTKTLDSEKSFPVELVMT